MYIPACNMEEYIAIYPSFENLAIWKNILQYIPALKSLQYGRKSGRPICRAFNWRWLIGLLSANLLLVMVIIITLMMVITFMVLIEMVMIKMVIIMMVLINRVVCCLPSSSWWWWLSAWCWCWWCCWWWLILMMCRYWCWWSTKWPALCLLLLIIMISLLMRWHFVEFWFRCWCRLCWCGFAI